MGLMTIIGNWRLGRATARELASLGTEGRRALACDLGLSVDKLVRLSAHNPASGSELPRLMRSLGLSPEKIGSSHSGVMRDMRIVCAGCLAGSRCRRDLDHGLAPAVQQYCPNNQTLSALLMEERTAFPPRAHH